MEGTHYMIQDIRKMTAQQLKNVFLPLDRHSDHVFWIRTGDMSHQIYFSEGHSTIWGRDDFDILYEIPMIWLTYLAQDAENSFMKQFS
jgi:hypothetical protein